MRVSPCQSIAHAVPVKLFGYHTRAHSQRFRDAAISLRMEVATEKWWLEREVLCALFQQGKHDITSRTAAGCDSGSFGLSLIHI